MQVLIVTIEGNIGAGKATLLQKFEKSLSHEDKVAIKVEHEPVKECQSFYGNGQINLLEHFFKNPSDKAFIFHNCVLDVYQQSMKVLETAQHSLQGYFHGLWS